jgi:hypothetical protein
MNEMLKLSTNAKSQRIISTYDANLANLFCLQTMQTNFYDFIVIKVSNKC